MIDPSVFEEWEVVIGLEIHVELNTQSKLFSPSPNHFGDEPNTNISYVCTGQPGTLPILNAKAVNKAVRFGCAVGAKVANYSRFDRKSYFYPDSPRNFQITQFDYPIVTGGSITVDVEGKPKIFQIHQAHLEDDAGMLKHFPEFAGVDYNRAGVPLIEIVSEPCMFSAKEAVAYAMGIKALLQYLEVSDCNMEEGSLRFDANISVRPKNEKTLRPKIEIKNLNSFNFLDQAIQAEFKRQVKEYLTHSSKKPEEVIFQSTYRWDSEANKIVLMRRKEAAEDYRYMIEPDLPPLILEETYIDSIRKGLPELPYEREKRYLKDFQLAVDAASILVNEKALSDYFERAVQKCSNPKALSNWIIVEFIGRFKESGKTLWDSGIDPLHIATLVNMIDQGTVTGKIAKSIADMMVETPGRSPETIVSENPQFQPISDEKEIEAIVDQILSENEASVQDFLSGKARALGYLVGQVMKATQGKASPQVVNRLLNEKIEKKRQP